MRKVLISLAAAATALAFASPASAQYYPQPENQPFGYGNAYNGYGQGNYGQVRAFQARIDAIQKQIRQLDRRDMIRDGSADRLKNESREIERRLRAIGRNGLNGYEANDIHSRIARLEQRVQYAMSSRYGRHDRNGNGHDHGWYGRYR
jgi:Spy/CpxP family protein refolding chaperone